MEDAVYRAFEMGTPLAAAIRSEGGEPMKKKLLGGCSWLVPWRCRPLPPPPTSSTPSSLRVSARIRTPGRLETGRQTSSTARLPGCRIPAAPRTGSHTTTPAPTAASPQSPRRTRVRAEGRSLTPTEPTPPGLTFTFGRTWASIGHLRPPSGPTTRAPVSNEGGDLASGGTAASVFSGGPDPPHSLTGRWRNLRPR